MSSDLTNPKPQEAQWADHAILILHGIDDLRFLRWIYPGYRYFRKLDKHLSDFQIPIYFPKVTRHGRVNTRGTELARFIDQLPQTNLHFIAHSMGGLDARFYISQLDTQRRGRSLRTVATPHRGTPVASWALEARGLLPWLIRVSNSPGLEDLTETACVNFNAENPDRDDVQYFSYIGSRPVAEMPIIARRLSQVIDERAGPNDFLVPVSSARWQSAAEPIAAHHAELVGWPLGSRASTGNQSFDHIKFYRQLIQDILSTI